MSDLRDESTGGTVGDGRGNATPTVATAGVADAPHAHAGIPIPPPLIYILFFLLGLLAQRLRPLPRIPTWMSLLPGALLTIASGVLAAWCFGLMWRARTSPLPHRPTTALVTRGPFRLSRNPLYLSLLLLYAGVALVYGQAWPLLFLPFVVIVVQHWVIRKEEAYLLRRYPVEYGEYQARVRRWI